MKVIERMAREYCAQKKLNPNERVRYHNGIAMLHAPTHLELAMEELREFTLKWALVMQAFRAKEAFKAAKVQRAFDEAMDAAEREITMDRIHDDDDF